MRVSVIRCKTLCNTIVFALLSVSVANAGGYASEVTSQISTDSYAILIKHGLCSNAKDCDHRDYLFMHSGISSIYIDYYRIISDPVISELVAVCINDRYQAKEKAPFKISFHAESYNDTESSFAYMFTSPIIQVQISGTK